jgi:ABC-type spermidine/putrescine transport system permease subunit I
MRSMERNPYAAPSDVADVAPEPSPPAGPAGLAGWLIILAIGLFATPIRLSNYLWQTFSPIFRNGTWRELTSPDSASYHFFWGPLLIAEIAINILFIVGAIYLLFIFFRKSRRFPNLFILFVVSNLAFVLVDAVAIRIVLPEEPILDSATARELGKALFGAIIWVPYMLLSKRVKNTFVRTDT